MSDYPEFDVIAPHDPMWRKVQEEYERRMKLRRALGRDPHCDRSALAALIGVDRRTLRREMAILRAAYGEMYDE